MELDPAPTNAQEQLKRLKLEQMNQRMQQRQEYLQKCRAQRSSKRSRARKESDIFLDKFNETFKTIETSLEGVTPENANEEIFKNLKIQAAELDVELGDKGRVLPLYLLEVSRKKLRELRTNIEESKKELAPAKKFRFSKRSKEGKTKKKEAVMSSAENTCMKQYISGDEIIISNHNLETIYMEPGSISGSDIAMSNLKNCTISICDSIGALRINDVSNCKLYLGPVASSVLVENITNSIVFMCVRQCRIHHAVDTDFYLLVNSDPIIEHSHSIRFAPYCFEYPELQDHFQFTGINQDMNSWDQVKDFNWLRQQQSPNWSIIPSDTRIKNVNPVLQDDDDDEF